MTLTDAVGRSVSKGPVTFRLSDPLSAKLVLSEEAPTPGESVTLFVNPSGGKPPLRCEAEISVEGQPPLRPPVGSYNDFEFTPAAAGKARATVTVTDAEGRSLVVTKDFTVVPPLDATLELSPDPERAWLGEPISVAVKATGGQGPYKYTYEWRSHSGTTLVQGPTTTKLASDSCTYADGTDGYVDVRIEDATGQLKEFTAKFAIDAFRLSVTLAPPEVVDLGGTITVTAEAGGGKQTPMAGLSQVPGRRRQTARHESGISPA